MKNKYPELNTKIKEIGYDVIHISTINVAELYFGAHNSEKKEENLKLLEEFTDQIKILGLTKNSAKRFGEVKSILKAEGKILSDSDIFIASIAIENSCTLITNNTSHFNRIKGLHVETWIN